MFRLSQRSYRNAEQRTIQRKRLHEQRVL